MVRKHLRFVDDPRSVEQSGNEMQARVDERGQCSGDDSLILIAHFYFMLSMAMSGTN